MSETTAAAFTIGLAGGMRLGLKDLVITCDQAHGIGICIHSEGWVQFGVNCKVRQEWKGEPDEHIPAHMWLRMEGGSPDGGASNCKFGPEAIIKKFAT